jgi:tRNA uridine 5-carboxymethylaminomethyl modification enzyme
MHYFWGAAGNVKGEIRLCHAPLSVYHMLMSTTYDYDVLVIGGGHAGTEAALAAARMGARTALLTTNLDTIGQMSCNPAIGGVAKGQIVREIDALGGAMGRAIDATGIQFRVLNRSKGPAMHGPRAQADKKAYQAEIKRLCEEQPNLSLRQETVDDLVTAGQGTSLRIAGIRVADGTVYHARAVVLCAGTFMRGLIHVGEAQMSGGRMGESATHGISGALKRLGFQLERFKTGTPVRLNGRTIDFDQTQIQLGDPEPLPFSFLNDRIDCEQLPCWITYTTPEVHELIQANLHRAPMYTGQIQSAGPRYCPSIETKIVRFADKDRHQLFLEPEGRRTHEVYVNGLSTSLPREVQDQMIRMIPGLARAEIVRYGYAIEYDFAPPDQLKLSLETKRVDGLYFAGQVNGTTGYEEAGGQGLLAGVNAVLGLQGKEPLVLGREEAYLGVMIDDLVTRGVDEPYRMFTSRAEYRLALRGDNADRRLTAVGHSLGLVEVNRWQRLQKKLREIARVQQLLDNNRADGLSLAQLLRRTEIQWDDLIARLPELGGISAEVAQQVTYDAKYEGYLARQQIDIDRQQRLAARKIPPALDFATVLHLRAEAREKFERVRPVDLAQAGRISGITPADLAVLTVHLESGCKVLQGSKLGRQDSY